MPANGSLDGELDLAALIDDFFRTSFSTDNALITEAIRRMLAAGGKRLRPRITLLAAQAVGGDPREHLAIAAYMELIHVATLVHDDVVDRADLRRGVNATAVDFGNRISVLAGDYLFAWIFKNVTAGYPSPIPHILSATLADICDGEVLQLRSLDDLSLTEAAYFEIARKKTASLFAASARCGAILAGGTPNQIEALTNYGRCLGLAFQMRDDLLDLTADEREIGKPVGNDLGEHKVTLPLIYALERADDESRRNVFAFYRGDVESPQGVIDVIRRHAGLARTQQTIVDTLVEAKSWVAELVDSPLYSHLVDLASALGPSEVSTS